MRDSCPILLAEDDQHDVLAMQRAWKKLSISNHLYVVNDGEECLDFLHRRGAFTEAAAPRPACLLLDLQLPKLNGHQVLKAIREDDSLHTLPVIILTSSDLEQDKWRSYATGANAYVRKPIGLDALSTALETMYAFWQLAETPPLIES